MKYAGSPMPEDQLIPSQVRQGIDDINAHGNTPWGDGAGVTRIRLPEKVLCSMLAPS
jgi:hypothetical protein